MGSEDMKVYLLKSISDSKDNLSVSYRVYLDKAKALDEKHRMDERIDNTPHAGTKWLTDVIEYEVIE
jgi:hypothetical protein